MAGPARRAALLPSDGKRPTNALHACLLGSSSILALTPYNQSPIQTGARDVG